MLTLKTMRKLPPNIDAFVLEVGSGMQTLYGHKARVAYVKNASQLLETSIAHPSVYAAGLFDGPDAAALLLGVRDGLAARISLLHVLKPYEGRSLETKLLRNCVKSFRAAGANDILAEFVPFCRLDIGAAFEELAFQNVSRLLMAAPLESPALSPVETESTREACPGDFPAIARVIVEAYADHPDAALHSEVRTETSAAAFVNAVVEESYGRALDPFLRVAIRDGNCAGAVLGCEIAPEVGFVLQLAVVPPWQGRGVGTALLRELAEAFRQDGLMRMVLGVTATNPARALYERLGFTTHREIDARVWRRTPLP